MLNPVENGFLRAFRLLPEPASEAWAPLWRDGVAAHGVANLFAGMLEDAEEAPIVEKVLRELVRVLRPRRKDPGDRFRDTNHGIL